MTEQPMTNAQRAAAEQTREAVDTDPVNHIHEVSATVDAALTREDLEGMNEAERLALVVGAAYGRALSERDQARADLADALRHLRTLVDEFPATSWAHANVAVEEAREFIQAIQAPAPVDSSQTPAEKD